MPLRLPPPTSPPSRALPPVPSAPSQPTAAHQSTSTAAGGLSMTVTVQNTESETSQRSAQPPPQTKPAIITVGNYQVVLADGSVKVCHDERGQVSITDITRNANTPVGAGANPAVRSGADPLSPAADDSDSQVSVTEIIDTRVRRPAASSDNNTAPSPARPPRPVRRARRIAVTRRETSSSESDTPLQSPPPYSPGGFWTSTREEVSIMEEVVDDFGVPMV